MKCGKGARRSSIAFSKAQHKTDGSHPNRPFSYRKQAAGETTGFHPPLPPQCLLFLFFEKRNQPPSEKTENPSRLRRTYAIIKPVR